MPAMVKICIVITNSKLTIISVKGFVPQITKQLYLRFHNAVYAVNQQNKIFFHLPDELLADFIPCKKPAGSISRYWQV